MLGVIVFLTIFVFTSSTSTDVERCDPRFGNLPIHTSVEGCTTMPCQLPRLREAVINVVFQAPHTIHSMRTIAQVNALGVNLNYTLGEHENTCNHLQNTYCPVLKNEVVVYTVKMLIEWWMPSIGVNIEFFVLDEKAVPVWCLLLRAQVIG